MLHVLAQGGMIRHRRGENGHIVEALCFTRDGYILADTGLSLFNRLRRRGFIGSLYGAPDRITQAAPARVLLPRSFLFFHPPCVCVRPPSAPLP